MLALGMAFIAKPKLLMIDELSLGLAPTIVEQLLVIVRRIQQAGHRDHPRRAVDQRRPHPRRAGLLHGEGRGPLRGADRRAARAGRHRALRVPRGRRRRHGRSRPGRRRARARQRRRGRRTGPSCSRSTRSAKRFGGIRAVDDTSFVLHEGEILGLIGPNGAGKTTIFDLISGFIRARRGPHRLRRRRHHRPLARPPRRARARPVVPGRPARPVAHGRREPRASASSATSTCATTSRRSSRCPAWCAWRRTWPGPSPTSSS